MEHPTSNIQHPTSHDDFRTLKATVPAIEFGSVQWAAKRVLHTLPNGKVGAVTLAEFMRQALLAKVREVVRNEIARGKTVPPDIAAVISNGRLPNANL